LAKGNTAILVCDNYYVDNAGRNYLHQNGIKFIAAIQENRFGWLYELVKPKVNKPGEWVSAYKIVNDTTGATEAITYHWSKDVRIRKKHTLSNAFRLKKKRARWARFHCTTTMRSPFRLLIFLTENFITGAGLIVMVQFKAPPGTVRWYTTGSSPPL
jgi:hypothetical protein